MYNIFSNWGNILDLYVKYNLKQVFFKLIYMLGKELQMMRYASIFLM